MTSQVVIRRADIEDAADVALVLTELNGTVGAVGFDAEHEKLPENTNVSPQQAESRLRGVEGIETVLLAYADGALAGFTSLRVIPYLDQDTPYAEVTQLHVRPAFRRQGIATKLIEEAEHLALDANATAVHILTAVENVDGQAFYRSAGYKAVCFEFDKYLERRPADA